MQKSWTPSDASLLRQLREKAGHDRASFAQRNTLSLKQLTELEDGGTGRFYTPEIKAHTGRTLLRKLGYVAPPDEPAVQEAEEAAQEPAAQAVAAVAVAPAAAATAAPKTSPSTTVFAAAPAAATILTAAVTEAGPRPVQAAHVVLPDPHARSADGAAPRLRASALRPALLGTSLLLVGGGLFMLLGPVTASRPAAPLPAEQRVEVARQAIEAAPPAAPAVASDATPALSVMAQPSAAPGAALAAVPVVAVIAPAPPQPAPVSAGACDAAARERATQYRSPSAARPGTYVYVQSVKGGSVCVIDGQNKQTVTALKPGESVTVPGVPPFLIHTMQWNDLRVFFQGLRVNLDTGSPPEAVVLNVF